MYVKSEVLLSMCKTLIHFGFPGDVLHRPLLREAYLIRITTERYVYMQDKISSKLSPAILLSFFLCKHVLSRSCFKSSCTRLDKRMARHFS
jgi:hypothetical protein